MTKIYIYIYINIFRVLQIIFTEEITLHELQEVNFGTYSLKEDKMQSY